MVREAPSLTIAIFRVFRVRPKCCENRCLWHRVHEKVVFGRNQVDWGPLAPDLSAFQAISKITFFFSDLAMVREGDLPYHSTPCRGKGGPPPSLTIARHAVVREGASLTIARLDFFSEKK